MTEYVADLANVEAVEGNEYGEVDALSAAYIA
jgi:hypothetical protein